MKSYKSYMNEKEITPSKEPNTMSFWHGGDLGHSYSDSMTYKKGRYEFGPGLYLTTHYDTAKKYAKGSRKLYMIVISKGNDLSNSFLPFEEVKNFVNTWVIGSKKKLILDRINKYNKDGKISGNILNNIIINEEAIKPTNMDQLRKFYVSNDIDYLIDSNTFGWNEKVMVLFNTKKIVSKTQIDPKDNITMFDLPTEFN